MNPVAKEYLERVRERLTNSSGNPLGRMSEWAERNTLLKGKPYSFTGHEYQRQIMDDTHYELSCGKPSQVGMSETMVRMVLAFLAKVQHTTAIYTMPTVKDAQMFAKSRMDPTIDESPSVKQLLKAGNDSSLFKQIGNSQLFMVGTHGKAIISVPTDMLMCDEVDFSSQEAMATAESRLSHSRFEDPVTGERGMRRRFSTPTVPGFGIDALYQRSDMHKRLVKCRHCSEWFWPQYMEHVVVDGWDRPMKEMTSYDVEALDQAGLVDRARLLCPSCHNPVTRADLEHGNRQWVAEHPERTRRGYWVSPFDLPSMHTPATLMRKLVNYREHTNHFYNFGLGIPYSDATNSVSIEVVNRNTVLKPVLPDHAKGLGIGGCIAGLDVGKTSWITVGKPVSAGAIDVLWAQKIHIGENGEGLFDEVHKLLLAFSIRLLVCDALPYTDSILRIQSSWAERWVLPTTYTLRDAKLPMYVVNEKDFSISANRTKVIDLAVKKINSGKMRFPVTKEMETVRSHLGGMKKIERLGDDGETVNEWVKCGDDHYFHSLVYLTMAATELGSEYGQTAEISVGNMIKTATVGGKTETVDTGSGLYRQEAASRLVTSLIAARNGLRGP